ncbi:S-formylglutathione hydrolase [Thermithiobacillus plumbiphilus]|uniref:S-formylglutathione hydrolase n=1 Tax=Thermithiobacillus plumbiphilus TaxID=1729899 RepID=A0ABU9D879_9PROT
MELLAEHQCFDGAVHYYRHPSKACDAPMRFGIYLPPQASQGPLPVLYYLAGLTCTEETFLIKGGAQRLAAELGIILVAPDTSPRDTGIAGEDTDWDFGSGAGFYLDASEAPWAQHYRMYSYVTAELPALLAEHFPVDPQRHSIFGHSMGGHGALVCALKNPDRYRSVSAFAPIGAPMQSPWGEKAFSGYLGADRASWRAWDASELVREHQLASPILIDQGTADKFLHAQLKPELFEAACRESGQRLELRLQPGYDHSYYFISSFMAEHLRFHAAYLKA